MAQYPAKVRAYPSHRIRSTTFSLDGVKTKRLSTLHTLSRENDLAHSLLTLYNPGQLFI